MIPKQYRVLTPEGDCLSIHRLERAAWRQARIGDCVQRCNDKEEWHTLGFKVFLSPRTNTNMRLVQALRNDDVDQHRMVV